jgi:hypothetical protein
MQLGYTGEAEWCPEANKQPRRCQAAEETRGPSIGRAHKGGGGGAAAGPLGRLRLGLAFWGFTGSRALLPSRHNRSPER